MKKFDTLCVHAGHEPETETGAVSMPIFANSTYEQSSPGVRKDRVYARGYNPTRRAFEEAIAAVENGTDAFAFASGMAAIDAVLDLLSQGSHIVAGNDLYGGTFRIFEKIRRDTTGLRVTYCDISDWTTLARFCTEETKMIWIETPSNPFMKIADLSRIAAFAKQHGIITVADNTFASPALQRPLDHGIDIVVHSVTKYIGGHSDLIGGAVIIGQNEILRDRIKFIQNATGGILGPFDSFLALRGLKSLHVRMDRHCHNAKAIAEYLQQHPRIEAVLYPGLANHPGHKIAQTQMRDFGGIVTMRLKSSYDPVKMMQACKLFTLAESLGGVESLICHPLTMTHPSVPEAQRRELGLDHHLIRLSVGIEDAGDLVADLDQALAAI